MRTIDRLDHLVPGFGRACWWLLLAGGAVYFGLYLVIALSRLAYPYHVEWMEGGSLQHVDWILGGHALYDRPSIVFTPYTYPPVYFYLCAGASWLLGGGLLPLRLVSLLASLGCFGLIFQLVRRESASPAAGFFAAALFAATFKLGGSWFDLARVDSLFLCLLLAAVYLVRFGEGVPAALAAAALLTLSYLTKQTALVLMPPLVVLALVRQRRWGLWFGGALAAFAGLGTLLLDGLSRGWFRYYVFDLPAELPFLHLSLRRFFWNDVLRPLWIAVAVAAVYLASLVRRPRRPALLFYAVLGAGLVGAAYLGRDKVGGFLNALQPAYAFIAVLCGLAAAEVAGWAFRHGEAAAAATEAAAAARPARPARPAWRPLLAAAFSLALLGQLVLLRYDPRLQVPSRSDRQAGDELVARIRGFHGDVLLPEFGYLAELAGKPPYAHSIATYDVMQGKDKRPGQQLLREMQESVRSDRFAAILFAQEDWADPEWLGADLADYAPSRIRYRALETPRETSFLERGARWAERRGGDVPHYAPEADVFLPLVGYQLRPVLLYTRKRVGGSRPEGGPRPEGASRPEGEPGPEGAPRPEGTPR